MGKYILSVFLLLISHLPVYGSSIIVMRDDTKIIIGADSKRVQAAKEDLSDAWSELVCKIVRADNIFIASAGIAGIDPYKKHGKIPAEFDLTEIMKKAALGEGSIIDKADALATAVDGALLKIYARMKYKMPAPFRKMFLGKQALQVIMAGMEGWTPIFIVMTFEPNISPSGELNINVEFRLCPGMGCPSGFVYIFMAKHEAIDRYLPMNPGIWKKDPVDVVRELLEIEVTSEPETVGPPIDILRITKEGSEWIQEKDICEDHSRPSNTSDYYSSIVSHYSK